MSRSKSVLIVGGGIIGLCTAYYAIRRGHRVTILERGEPGHDSCAIGSAGMIVPSHFVPLAAPGMVGLGIRMMWNPESPFYIRPRLNFELANWGFKFCRAATRSHVERSAPLLRDLSLASRRCFEELDSALGGELGLVKRGLLMLCRSEHSLREETEAAHKARSLGIPAQILTPVETAELEPGIRMNILGSVYYPQDCHLHPQRLLASLTRAIENHGARLLCSTEVIGWSVRNGRIQAVKTRQGEISADEYVLAGGSWSPQIARGLGIRLPMQAGKGYSFTLPDPKSIPGICAILTEARVAVTPLETGLRFGGTMEIAGLDLSINQRRVNGIIKSIPTYFPDFNPDDFTNLPVWCGLRPCSPDGLPYLGRVASYQNLSLATGHAMMGLSLGPITGKLMTEILSDEKPAIDLSLLNPNRYR